MNFLNKTVFAAAICASFAAPALAGDFSEGYRMGQLVKYSEKGMLNKSGEGELMMGRESTPWVIVTTDDKGNQTRNVRNPWSFSSDIPTLRRYEGLGGEYVVVHYRQLHINNPLEANTDYRVIEMHKIDPKPVVQCASAATKAGYSNGFRVGRIVKASTKGTFLNSYEITMQVGNAGGTFVDMSADQSMFACATQWLMSGKKVKVGYSQSLLRNPLNRDTSYAILSLTPVADLQ